MIPNRNIIKADGSDVSVITVQVKDSNGKVIPDDCSKISFSLQGPGKIIGVGNGDPSSHEPDRYFETVQASKIVNLKEFAVNNLENRPEVAAGFDELVSETGFGKPQKRRLARYKDTLIVIRGTFELQGISNETIISLFTKSIVENQSVYVNGHLIASGIKRDEPGQAYVLGHRSN